MNNQESRALHDGAQDTDINNNNSNYEVVIETSLADRIIPIIQDAPGHIIRPARVAAELGISVNDACSELCALMATVGGGDHGASFRFTTTTTTTPNDTKGPAVMEFQFPPDFAKRARQRQRWKDWKTSCKAAANIAIRALKVIAAFGLMVSLLILCVMAIAVLFALLIAASRAGHDQGGHRSILTRQIRSLFYTIRQLLWFYAVFGPSSPEGQDPVLREMAYDLSLLLSCCCGNPASFFYWLRARQLANRQQQAMRRWRDSSVVGSDIPGVFLVRNEGQWNQGDGTMRETLSSSSAVVVGGNHKGLLSIAIEFLFGPDPPQPEDPSVAWRLRVAAILNCSSKHKDGGISLAELSPYVDNPPTATSQHHTTQLVEQTILIVAHFNGIPNETTSDRNERLLDATFFFPELIAESDMGPYQHSVLEDDETFAAFLFRKDGTSYKNLEHVPDYWHEERYKFTTLTATQLFHCAILGTLNFLGVQWLYQWTRTNGILFSTDSAMGYTLAFLFPILQNYAVLFLFIPVCRMLLLLFLNRMRRERNKRRQALAMGLS